MKGLLKEFRKNKKGFTLAELLVVVAIVAILVAISVPIFTTQLGKARRATNQANMRAAKVAAISQYLTDGHDGEKTYVYSIEAAINKFLGASFSSMTGGSGAISRIPGNLAQPGIKKA